jgi:hypothetical protein
MVEIYFSYILTASEIYGYHVRNNCDKTRVQLPVRSSGEARYINFIVFGLTVPVIERVFYHNYYGHGNRKSLMRLKCMRNRFQP